MGQIHPITSVEEALNGKLDAEADRLCGTSKTNAVRGVTIRGLAEVSINWRQRPAR